MPMTTHVADPGRALRAAVLLAVVVASALPAIATSTTFSGPTFWYTYPDMSGNRVVGPGSIGCGGGGTFPDEDDFRLIDVDVGETAHVLWALGVVTTSSSGYENSSGYGEDEDEGNGDYDEVFRFVVTLRNGTAYVVGPAHRDTDDDEDCSGTSWGATPIEDYSPLTAEQPPLVRVDDEGIITVVSLPDAAADMSAQSHPVHVPIGFVDVDAENAAAPSGESSSLQEIYAYIATDGDVVLWGEGSELHRLVDVGALPDGRIAVEHLDNTQDDDARAAPLLALYGGSTDNFRHCVLGDCLEGTRLLLIRAVVVPGNDETSASAQLEIEADIRLREETGEVFEGTMPFFYRDDNDDLVVVTTVGNPTNGARLQTYSRSGTGGQWRIRSVGPSIGWGWRHQLFRGHLGPNMTIPALVDVLAPHVRMTVEFFDDEYGTVPTTAAVEDIPRMDLLASTSRYTTHRIGSRVLDTSVSGDVDGDGTREAVVLDENFRSLVGINLHSAEGGGFEAAETWRLPLPSTATSNLAAVVSSCACDDTEVDGEESERSSRPRMALGIGVGNVFRMWLPRRRCCAGDDHGCKMSSVASSSSVGGGGHDDVASTTGRSAGSVGSRGTMSPWVGITVVAMVSFVVVVGALVPS